MASGGGTTFLLAFLGVPCRHLSSMVLPGAASTYNCTEDGLSGWYNIKADGDNAYVYFGHGDKWDAANEGVKITAEEHITRFFRGEQLGYYTARGFVRLERIEFVPLIEEN
jgi:hypothetical protein